jgi:hypothetical protein
MNHSEELKLLSIVIPAQDEENNIATTVEHLHVELRLMTSLTRLWSLMMEAPTKHGRS